MFKIYPSEPTFDSMIQIRMQLTLLTYHSEVYKLISGGCISKIDPASVLTRIRTAHIVNAQCGRESFGSEMSPSPYTVIQN